MTLTLKELISSLKNDLRAAQDDAEDPMFVLGETKIKTRIIVVDKTKAGGGVKFLVASGNVEAIQEETSEHEIEITLMPIKVVNLGDD